MDKNVSIRAQLILPDHKKAYGQAGKVGDAHGSGCLLLFMCYVCISPPSQENLTKMKFVSEKSVKINILHCSENILIECLT
jgi:hypothetical protein